MRKRKALLAKTYKWEIWWRRHTTFSELFFPTIVITPEDLGIKM